MTMQTNHTPPADTSRPLPKVTYTDRTGSDKWGESILKQAGPAANDSTLQMATEAHTQLVRGLHNLVKQRNTPDPSIRQLEHLRRVQRGYDTLVQTGARRGDKARAAIKERTQQVYNELETATGFNERDAAEIRTVMRGMSTKDRNNFIDTAISGRDGNAMAAIFRAHPSLSGLTKESQQAHYRHAMLQHHPKGLKLIESMEKVENLLRRSFDDLLMSDETITAAQVRKDLEAQSRKAAEAEKAAKAASFDSDWR